MEDAPVHLRAASALVLWCVWAAPRQGVLRCGESDEGGAKGSGGCVVGFHVARDKFAGAAGQRGSGFPAYGEGVALAGPWYRDSGGKLCGGGRTAGPGNWGGGSGRTGKGQNGQWERVRYREDVVL